MKKQIGSRILSVFTLLIILWTPFFQGIDAVLAAPTTMDTVQRPTVDAVEDDAWPMAGANPQRTSWTPEEVRGRLQPLWYKPIEPYIQPKTQVIAAYGMLYVSTARGLYALDADTGEEVWVYPTEMPLGHSPTIAGEVAYVGGFDRKLHAINAYTGERLWTFEAEAGFATNPLVVDGKIYAGNRDGYLYAIHAEHEPNAGELAWRFKTDGAILFSAAYVEDAVYFASNDAHAYALDAENGSLIWKSDPLPGAGFHSWWPVVHQNAGQGANVVIFAGSDNYRHFLPPDSTYDLLGRELADIYPDRHSDPKGTLYGARNAAGEIDATHVLNYFEEKPWRRTYLVLDRATGQEITFDFDSDGNSEYAPILWHGTHSGNRYPPVVGADQTLYQANNYMSDSWIAGGQISGWAFGSQYISTPSALWRAVDEPLAYSAGGDLIYWNHCNDRSAGAFDISIPNTHFYPDSPDSNREWLYFDYNLESIIPGYNFLYRGVSDNGYTINNLYQGTIESPNGVYGQHGDQNPPIPYDGRVYMHRSNVIIAFDSQGGSATALPIAETVDVDMQDPVAIGTQELRNRLTEEVQKILDAGHLRPGYRSVGLFDHRTKDQNGDYLIDYWHNPTNILYALSIALPHLPASQQQAVISYMEDEYQSYPPDQYTHLGWADGARREAFALPDEVQDKASSHLSGVTGYDFEGWSWPPHMFYELWKYAQVAGDAADIFARVQDKLENLEQDMPSDAYLIEYPYVHNAYIAGYIGYLELEALAGHSESSTVKAELNRLLELRASTFDKDTSYTDGTASRALSVARNFMYLTPELASYLHDHALAEVQTALEEYNTVAPYWFVSKFEATHGEGAVQHFYDYHALFQAHALILQKNRADLIKYLDVPATEVGDLFYIHNLVSVLNASITLEKTVQPTVSIKKGDTLTYMVRFNGDGSSLSFVDNLPDGLGEPIILDSSSIQPTYEESQHRLVWTGALPDGATATIRYQCKVITNDRQKMTNIADLEYGDGRTATASTSLMVNAIHVYLPMVIRQ